MTARYSLIPLSGFLLWRGPLDTNRADAHDDAQVELRDTERCPEAIVALRLSLELAEFVQVVAAQLHVEVQLFRNVAFLAGLKMTDRQLVLDSENDPFWR